MMGPAARGAAVSAAVFVLVFAVAFGASRSLARVGGPGRAPVPPLPVGDVSVAFAVAGLIVVAVLGYALWGGRRRGDDQEQTRAVAPAPKAERLLLLALTVVTMAVTAATLAYLAVSGPHAGRARSPVQAGRGGRLPGAGGPGHPAGPGHVGAHWLVWAAVAVCVAAAGALVAVRRRRDRAPAAEPPRAGQSRIVAAVEASLADLGLDADPRRAVIRAYAAMEGALARHGLGRRPSEAPREYLARALSAARVSPGASERLTGLFEVARYSQHPVAARARQEAADALAAVRDELASGEP